MKIHFIVAFLLSFGNISGQSITCEWAERIGSGNEFELNSFLDLDEGGNVYITGYLGENSTFDNDSTKYFEGFYLAKFDSLKTRKWIARLGDKPSFSTGTHIKYKSGYLYIGGKFNDTVVVNNDTFYTHNYNKDYFLSKFDTLGNLIWFKHIPKKDYSYSKDIVAIDVNRKGDILFCGNFNLEIELDTIKLNNTKAPLLFIPFFSVFDSTGKIKYAKQIEICANHPTYSCESIYNAACFDSYGNIFTILSSGDSSCLLIDSANILNFTKDGYLVKFNPMGILQWAKKYPQLRSNDYGKIFSDFSNSIYASYTTTSNLSVFGVSRFDTTGNLIWNAQGNYFATHSNWDFIYDYDKNQIYILILIPHSSFVLNGDSLTDSSGVWFLNYDNLGNLIFAQLLKAPNSQPGSIRIDNFNLYTSGFFYHVVYCEDEPIEPLPNTSTENIIIIKSYYNNLNVEENKKVKNTISVHPNPTSDVIYINVEKIFNNTAQIEIFNIHGNKVGNYMFTSIPASISVSKLAKGIYFLRVTDSEKSVTVKFVKE